MGVYPDMHVKIELLLVFKRTCQHGSIFYPSFLLAKSLAVAWIILLDSDNSLSGRHQQKQIKRIMRKLNLNAA